MRVENGIRNEEGPPVRVPRRPLPTPLAAMLSPLLHGSQLGERRNANHERNADNETHTGVPAASPAP